MARMKRPRPSLEEILRILQAHLPELHERYGVRTLMKREYIDYLRDILETGVH